MEQAVEQKQNISKTLWPALMVVGIVCLMIVIVYGMESIAPGVHDAFHDFRHAIGMPCH